MSSLKYFKHYNLSVLSPIHIIAPTIQYKSCRLLPWRVATMSVFDDRCDNVPTPATRCLAFGCHDLIPRCLVRCRAHTHTHTRNGKRNQNIAPSRVCLLLFVVSYRLISSQNKQTNQPTHHPSLLFHHKCHCLRHRIVPITTIITVLRT